jgi:hypothetical protein
MIIVLTSGNQVIAQSFSADGVRTVSVSSVYELTKVDNASGSLNFTTVSQIADAVSITNLSTFSVKSNVPWVFSASSATANFLGVGVYASTNMPASVLSLQVPGQAARVLSTTNQTLTTGTRGTAAVAGNTFSLNLTATPGFSYGPGSYTISVNYTLTAQ